MTDAELADHYGELDRQVTLFEPTREEWDAAKKALNARAESATADAPVFYAGKLYRVQLGARKNERTITDQAKAFKAVEKALGKAGAIAAVTIPLGLVDKCVPASAQTFIAKEQSGSRSIEAVALAPLPPAA